MATSDVIGPKLFARLDRVSVQFGEKIVLRNLLLDIIEGAITCIIGLSRAGKSPALRCVLYDEPLTELDPITTHMRTDSIVDLRERLDGTVVVVSHDVESIYRMADFVMLLYEGAIVSYGTCDQLRSSSNPIVQQFVLPGSRRRRPHSSPVRGHRCSRVPIHSRPGAYPRPRRLATQIAS